MRARDARQQRRLVEVAGAIAATTRDDHLRAGRNAARDLSDQLDAQIVARHRADGRRRITRIADDGRAQSCGHRLGELGGDAAVDDEALRGDAALSAVEQPRVGRPCSRACDVRVLEHDERIGSAELEHRPLAVRAGDRGDRTPPARRAGERHALDAHVSDDVGDDVGLRAQRLHDAGGQSCLGGGSDDRLAGAHRVRGALEQQRVPTGDDRRDHPDRLPVREVPRHDGEHRADGVVAHDVAQPAEPCDVTRGEEARGVRRVVVEPIDALHDLAARLCERLAHLGGQQQRQPVGVPLEHVGERGERGAPLRQRTSAPVVVRRVRSPSRSCSDATALFLLEIALARRRGDRVRSGREATSA